MVKALDSKFKTVDKITEKISKKINNILSMSAAWIKPSFYLDVTIGV